MVDTEVNNVVEMVLSGNVSEQSLRHFSSDWMFAHSGRIIDLLIAQPADFPCEIERVSACMRLLETAARNAMLPSCILMMGLWPIAGSRYMHDVCDAIDLWLWHCEATDRKVLQQLNNEFQQLEAIKQHFARLFAAAQQHANRI